MIRTVLLFISCILLLFQRYLMPMDTNTQFIIFLAGVVLLGVPHGAADLLVANRNAAIQEKPFSTFRFLFVYISRLFLFAVILLLFPVAGMLLFILFAAYHFGETDLYRFKTNTIPGKLFVISYGLLILSVIILHHFDEVSALIRVLQPGKRNAVIISWIAQYRYCIMSVTGIFFFTAAFTYFLKNRYTGTPETGQFLIHFAVILIVLFNLPLMLGFTFYFVVWHSVLSLRNIVLYLRHNGLYSRNIIVRQILLYTVLALLGIGLFGLTGFMFLSSYTMAASVFLGLAVLTAPHMQVMHDMYNSIRDHRHVRQHLG